MAYEDNVNNHLYEEDSPNGEPTALHGGVQLHPQPTPMSIATVYSPPHQAPTATVYSPPHQAPTATVYSPPHQAPTATVYSPPHQAPTASVQNKHGVPHTSKSFYLLPGISDKAKRLHEESTEKTYNYRHMFDTTSPPLPDVVNTAYKYCYEGCSQALFYALSFLLAPLVLLVLAILSGLFSFLYTWLMSPIYNIFDVIIPRMARPLKVMLQHCVAPYCSTVGELFSSIRVKYTKVPVHDASTTSIA